MISQKWKFLIPMFGCLAISLAGCSALSRVRNSPHPVVVPADEALTPGTIVTEIRPDVDHVYRQTAFHPDGVTARLVKHCFVNFRGSYLSPRGNYVVYEYLRQDGTLEKQKLVKPIPMLSSSVICKYRWTYYAADGKTELRSEVYRADDTLGASSDAAKNSHTQYRLDGVTLRQIQSYDGKSYQVVHFRKDGTTKWWEFDYGTDRGTVHFDREGKAIKRTFTRNSFGSYSMGSDDPPKETHQDNYLRADGTLEYRQTWCHFYYQKTDDFYDALCRIQVFSADGKTIVRTLRLEPRAHTGQLFIKSSTIVNQDGTFLLRYFSSPGVRQAERLFGKGPFSSKTQFGPNDGFEEPVDPIWLQGFGPGLNLYGDDTDFNDK